MQVLVVSINPSSTSINFRKDRAMTNYSGLLLTSFALWTTAVLIDSLLIHKFTESSSTKNGISYVTTRT